MSMQEFINRQRQSAGRLLVLLQFGLLLLMASVALPQAWVQGVPGISAVLALLSLLLGLWTLAHNRFGNFNIHPAPKMAGVLVTSGPYRWVRHPMYSSVLLAAAALAPLLPLWLALLTFCSLFIVLLAKARLEERWLGEWYPQYADYCQRSKRFLPWVL